MQTQNLLVALSAAITFIPSVYAADATPGPGAFVKAKCPYTVFMPRNGQWTKTREDEADADSEEQIRFAKVKFAADCKIVSNSAKKLLFVKNGHVDSI